MLTERTFFQVLRPAVLALAACCVAHANPIQVAYSPVTNQPANNGVDTLTTWASADIDLFNAAHYAGYPLPTLGDYQFNVTPGDANPIGPTFLPSTAFSITLDLTGYKYIILSWGGSNIPSDTGTADYLYYIGNTTTWTFYDSHAGASGDGSPALANGGLSGITVFGRSTQVPDGGTTVLLVGLGLVGIGLVARRFKKSAKA